MISFPRLFVVVILIMKGKQENAEGAMIGPSGTEIVKPLYPWEYQEKEKKARSLTRVIVVTNLLKRFLKSVFNF